MPVCYHPAAGLYRPRNKSPQKPDTAKNHSPKFSRRYAVESDLISICHNVKLNGNCNNVHIMIANGPITPLEAIADNQIDGWRKPSYFYAGVVSRESNR